MQICSVDSKGAICSLSLWIFLHCLNKAKLVLVFNRGRVLEALMEQKSSGKIKGIFGRLVRDFK